MQAKTARKILFALLVLATITAWIAAISGGFTRTKELKLVACDVGQGDAILAVYGQNQILIDGGPGRAVLDCLGRHLPFYDRKIELVVITHPQTDHFGGIIDVLKAYKVEAILANSLDASSESYGVLKKSVEAESSLIINPTGETAVKLGMMQFDVIWPSQHFLLGENAPDTQKGLGLYASKRDPNDFSIVGKLSLGEFDALLTGDIGPEIIAQVLATGEIDDIEYIKVPHHGSRNGLTPEFLTASSPEVAVISSGRNNSYGHPHKEVLTLLKGAGVSYYRTDLSGDIVVQSDGKLWKLLD